MEGTVAYVCMFSIGAGWDMALLAPVRALKPASLVRNAICCIELLYGEPIRDFRKLVYYQLPKCMHSLADERLLQLLFLPLQHCTIGERSPPLSRA